MHSAEVLSQLRTLDWLGKEAKRLPAQSPERALLDTQINALRSRLPVVILQYHDDRSQRGLPDVANLNGTTCGNCNEPLPRETVHELASSGRFVVCPKCGIFLWSGDTESRDDFPTRTPSASVDVSAKTNRKGARRE